MEIEKKDIELFKEMWYKRYPAHENNADTGEDMFWGTAELVAREYVSKLIEIHDVSKTNGDAEELFPYEQCGDLTHDVSNEGWKWIKASERLPEDFWQGRFRDLRDNSLKEYKGSHELDKGRFSSGSTVIPSRFVEWLAETHDVSNAEDVGCYLAHPLDYYKDEADGNFYCLGCHRPCNIINIDKTKVNECINDVSNVEEGKVDFVKEFSDIPLRKRNENVSNEDSEEAYKIVDENFKGLWHIIEDENLSWFYRELIVTCMQEWRNKQNK